QIENGVDGRVRRIRIVGERTEGALPQRAVRSADFNRGRRKRAIENAVKQNLGRAVAKSSHGRSADGVVASAGRVRETSAPITNVAIDPMSTYHCQCTAVSNLIASMIAVPPTMPANAPR